MLYLATVSGFAARGKMAKHVQNGFRNNQEKYRPNSYSSKPILPSTCRSYRAATNSRAQIHRRRINNRTLLLKSQRMPVLNNRITSNHPDGHPAASRGNSDKNQDPEQTVPHAAQNRKTAPDTPLSEPAPQNRTEASH